MLANDYDEILKSAYTLWYHNYLETEDYKEIVDDIHKKITKRYFSHLIIEGEINYE